MKISSVLIDEKQIRTIVNRLGTEITAHYQDITNELIVICLLKGSFIFTADLVRKINIPTIIIDFIKASSYNGSTMSSGNVEISSDFLGCIIGKHILLIEDIADTGRTLNNVIKMLSSRNPASLKTCTLLDKPSRRKVTCDIDFTGIIIPDTFIVGYGLDFAEKYRNLPYIGVLDNI